MFRVRACSELTKLCGNWSSIVSGTTMDGQASAPPNLHVQCNFYNVSGRAVVAAHWEPPLSPNGKLMSYQIMLTGVSHFRSERGQWRSDTYGPKIKSVSESLRKAEYDNVPLNTNYTLRVSGVTRSKRPGDFASASCVMPRSTPEVNHVLWGKIRSHPDRAILKLFMPRLSERNGPICGYRIFLMRLPPNNGSPERRMPPIHELPIMTYHEVHAANNTNGGVYIAETFSQKHFQSDLILGDGERIADEAAVAGFAEIQNEECKKLLNGHFVRKTTARPPKTTSDDSAEGEKGETLKPLARAGLMSFSNFQKLSRNRQT